MFQSTENDSEIPRDFSDSSDTPLLLQSSEKIKYSRTSKKFKSFHSFWAQYGVNKPMLQFFWRTSKSELSQKKISFGLSFFACFMVVVIVALLVSMLSNTAVLFLKLAELEKGEMDFTITGGESETLNYTLITHMLRDKPHYKYSTVRTSIEKLALFSASECRASNATDWAYSGDDTVTCRPDVPADCFSQFCYIPHSANLLMYDTKLEDAMDLGRDWTRPALPEGHAYVSKALARSGSLQEGDTFYVEFNVTYLSTVWTGAFPPNPNQNKYPGKATRQNLFLP